MPQQQLSVQVLTVEVDISAARIATRQYPSCPLRDTRLNMCRADPDVLFGPVCVCVRPGLMVGVEAHCYINPSCPLLSGVVVVAKKRG